MPNAPDGAFLRHSCGRKDAEIAAVRQLFGPKSVAESPLGPGRSGQTFAPKAERHRLGANHPQTWFPHSPQAFPFRPAHLPSQPGDRGDGFLRSHGPAEDIVNHQSVNVRLMLLRATAARADENPLEISGASQRCPKGRPTADATRWRIFASLSRHSCGSKTLESPLFDSFFDPKSAVESPRRRKSLPAQRLYAKCTDATGVAHLTATPRTPGLPLSPRHPAPLAPLIRGDGFPRSHGPAKDIVNHQRVNVWLTLLRATAAGADEKFGGISWASQRCPESSTGARCDRWRISASLLRHSCGRKDAEITAFRQLFGRKSVVESTPRPGRSGQTLAPKAERHRLGANHPQT
jgi:hypothetical protein